MKLYNKILTLFLLICILPFVMVAQNATLYPGDVNNNGIANHIDLLYIGSAFGEAGNARVDYEYFFTSNVSGGTAPYSYSWTSTNGLVSTDSNPSFIFDALGTYTICVEVTDALGMTSTVCNTILVGQDEDCGFSINITPDIAQNTYLFSVDSMNIQSTNFEWDFGDNSTSILAEPTHTFLAEGIYTVCLSSTNLQGQICTECIDLVVNNDSTNLFCTVQSNYNEILTENFNWEEQLVPIIWDSSFNNGLNYAYADCDGDGFIDELDVGVLEQNYSLTHGDVELDIFSLGTVNIDPIISLGIELDTLATPEGMTVELPIILGDLTNPVTDFYGIAFTIEYDPGYILNDSIDIQFLLNSWINPANSGLISIQSNDTENGLIEASISRINHLSVNGFGEIGTVSFIIEDNLVGALQQDDNEALDIRIRDVRMVDERVNNQAIAVKNYSLSFDTLTSINTLNASNVRIYPNPASDQLLIETPERDTQHIGLYDLTGKIMNIPLHTDNRQITMYTYDIPSGIYFVKIETNQTSIVQKIIIQKK